MKVSYEESLANYFGLQRRGGSGDRSVLSVRAKGNAGQPLNSDIIYQQRYKSFPIQDEEYFFVVCRYVERNARRAGLIKRAEDSRGGVGCKKTNPNPDYGHRYRCLGFLAGWLASTRASRLRQYNSRIRSSHARAQSFNSGYPLPTRTKSRRT